MHSNAATRFLSKLGVEQLEPVVHNLTGRRGTIIKRPVLEREQGWEKKVSGGGETKSKATTK